MTTPISPTGFTPPPGRTASRPGNGGAGAEGTAPPPSPPRSAQDSVRLSPEATQAMAARAFTLPLPSPDGAAPDGVAAELELRMAQGEHDLKMAEYNRKAMDALRQTLNLPDDQPMMLGGAANSLLDRMAERIGLEKPRMSDRLKAAGVKDPFDDDAKAEAGVIGLGVPGSGRELQIAFDRRGITGTAKPGMVAVGAGNDGTASLLGALKGGALGRFTDTRPMDGAKLWAVTDGGQGPNARVVASVRSVGMDETANTAAAGLLGALKGLFADG